MELRPRTLARGFLTFLPVVGRKLAFSKSGGTHSARYCYSVWMRHWLRLKERFPNARPRTVGEAGPGDSLGTGVCALLLGASQYHAFDVQMLAHGETNLQVLKELASMLKRSEAIPDQAEFPMVFPTLLSDECPTRSFTIDDLEQRERDIADALRDLNALGTAGGMISYHSPGPFTGCAKDSIDFLFSQAVMSYADDLPATYRYFGTIVKPGGFMSHTIPCDCIGTTKTWNGHYSVPAWQWRLAKGRRPCFISRTPCSRHLDLITTSGFDIVAVERRTRSDGITRSQLAPEFRSLSDADLTTSGMFVLARRRMS